MISKFNSCLEQGKKYEVETLKYLDYDTYEFSQGKCKEWDILIKKDNTSKYIEVKSEILAGKTGNLCIEYECNKKPSGIRATIAEYYYCYVLYDTKPYEVYKISTKIIKQMIDDKKYHKDVAGGDGYSARMYLFKKDLFKDYQIKNI